MGAAPQRVPSSLQPPAPAPQRPGAPSSPSKVARAACPPSSYALDSAPACQGRHLLPSRAPGAPRARQQRPGRRASASSPAPRATSAPFSSKPRLPASSRWRPAAAAPVRPGGRGQLLHQVPPPPTIFLPRRSRVKFPCIAHVPAPFVGFPSQIQRPASATSSSPVHAMALCAALQRPPSATD